MAVLVFHEQQQCAKYVTVLHVLVNNASVLVVYFCTLVN
jgi:hypothetical protein